MTTTRIPQNQEKINEAFSKFIGALEKTKERRELWKTEIKSKIIDVLTLVQQTYKFDWQIQKLEDLENYQTINLHCNIKKSGIVETKTEPLTGKVNSVKAYVKYGGYLAYCQSYNGKINVIIGFPYIEEWVDQMDTKVIATIEPNELTEDLITMHVIKFLETMTEWEGVDRIPIGYKFAKE